MCGCRAIEPEPVNLEIFSTPGRSGYIDTNGKIVIEKDFLQFHSFSNGLAVISTGPGTVDQRNTLRWGFIDKNGNTVIPPKFTEAGDFSEGLAPVALAREAKNRPKPFWDYLKSEPPSPACNRTPDEGYWEQESLFTQGHCPGPWGFIDRTGKVVIPLSFDGVRGFSEGLAYARGKGCGLIDKSGQWIIENRRRPYHILRRDFSEGLAGFGDYDRMEEYQGFLDKEGNVVIPARFHKVYDFTDGRAAFMTKCYDYGFIDKTGTAVVKPRYKSFRPFSEGLAAVLRNSKWGYINCDGGVAIPLKYERALGFSCGLAAVSIDGKWGYIDRTGKIVIAPQFAGASVFRDNRARVNIGGNYCDDHNRSRYMGGKRHYSFASGAWRFIDKSGKFISDIKFDNALDFREDLAAFRVFRKSGLKDGSGRILLPAQYDRIDDEFVGGLAKVVSRGRWGFINESGKLVVPVIYQEVRDSVQGLAAVKVDGKWGYVDRTGKFAVKLQFDDAKDFSEDRAAVQFPPDDGYKSGKWGYIDTAGRIVIPPKFRWALSFHESLAAVWMADGIGYIDQSGKMVIQPQLQEARDFKRGLAVVGRISLGGKGDAFWGVVDKRGKYIVPAILRREPKVSNGIYSFDIRRGESGQAEKCTVNRQGLVSEGDKVLGTVSRCFLPNLIEAVDSKDQQLARSSLCALSVIGGTETAKALRKSIESPDAYTRMLGAMALGEVTQQDPLDILLKQLTGAGAEAAGRASETIMLLIEDPPTAATFLGKSSAVPGNYRNKLIRRAVMAVTFGPRVNKSWRTMLRGISLRASESSQFFQFMRDVSGSHIFVDWPGLADLSVEPDTELDIFPAGNPSTTAAFVWDEVVLANLRKSKVGSIVVGEITVVAAIDRLEAIAGSLSARPPIGRKKPEENRNVEKRLQVPICRIDLAGAELQDVLELCSDSSGVRIEADWAALAKVGIEPTTVFDEFAPGMYKPILESALKLILLNAAGPEKLAYKIDDGKIHIIEAPKTSIRPLPSPVAALTGALKHADRELRLRAAEALGNIGPGAKTAIGALTKMLKDKDKEIRKAAAEAIRKINRTPATKPKP